MAIRPENTRTQNIFNPGVDKRMPVGFVDQVIDKATGKLVGFIKDGKFYNLGEKVEEKPKAKKADSVKDLNFKIKQAEIRIDKNEDELFGYEESSADYKEIRDSILRDKAEIKRLKPRLDTAKKIESDKKETKEFKKEKSNYDAEVADARKEIQIAKDTDGDVAAAEEKLKQITLAEPSARDSSKPFDPMAGRAPEFGAKPTPPATGGTPSAPSTGGAGGAGAGGPVVPKKTKTPALTDEEERLAALANAAANQDFSLPETLFNNVDELKKLLNDYVTSDKKGGQWTLKKFRNEFLNTNWYKNNSKEIKSRYVQLYNYRDQLEGGQDVSTTDYAKQIALLTRQLENKAREIGSDAASDPDALRRTAENMYIVNQGIEDSITIDFLAASIRPVAGMIGGRVTEGYSGQALSNYKALVQTARNNGFQISDILPGGANEQQVLSGIASGKIDINRVAQDARKLAAQGQPQYVRDLLSQGFDLAQVFQPYRQTMANILEIGDPDQIDLNDPLLRSAITDKGDMNLYDFRKALRQDNRWQYTAQAKEDVSTAALQVLRDFGFQG
jgi:hypothetical protein